ncbi:MAG: VWA domain-containing protein [Mycobacterium sp.]|nr:VWA domain-containing protein [Mycobacterium sp.]
MQLDKKDSLSGDEVSTDSLARLSVLASALSGCTLRVAPAESGEPAWTDGATVFVDADASKSDQLATLTVQASLLAAGSLEPQIVRRLSRRRGLARRYLAVEGHRALSANAAVLPPSMRSLVDSDVAARSDSPAASLAAALRRGPIADPPQVFGAIRPRNLLAVKKKDTHNSAGDHIPPRQLDKVLPDIDDEESNDAGDTPDLFSSPVGGGGTLGRLLRKMLGAVRRLGEGGQPGADAPTHRARSGKPGGGNAVVSTASARVPAENGEARGTKYPEWDAHRRRYRPDWCTVQEIKPRPTNDVSVRLSDHYGLRRPLARLGVALDLCHRQAQGDDIDIDAAVEARVDAVAGSPTDEAVYLDSLRRRRDLAVLLLLDISGSVAEPGAIGQTVHEQQRAAAVALAVTLHDLGDRLALYAFHSQGRSAVHLMPVKRFDDGLDALVLRRLGGLVPGAYSRMGAAIRHGAAVLERRGGTSQRLLVVLSDGLAYDHGYERNYGAADAHRALAEARRRGTGCLCLTIGASTDADELQRVFGSAAHARIPRLEQLGQVIGPLFRSALVSAEARRRVSQRRPGGPREEGNDDAIDDDLRKVRQ